MGIFFRKQKYFFLIALTFIGATLASVWFFHTKPPSLDIPGPAITYRDATHVLRHDTWSSFVDSMVSSGVCILDANGDEKLDLFFPGPGESSNVDPEYFASRRLGNTLFLNRGISKDGLPIFEDVSDAAGIRNLGKIGVGCAVADYNNDGREDVVVTNATRSVLFSAYGYLRSPQSESRIFPPPVFHSDGTDGKYNFPEEGGVTFFRNDGNDADGNPKFSDQTFEARLTRGGNGTSAAWADVDNDGFVDLFVANYSDFDFAGFSSPHFGGQFNVLYRNNGDGTFTDMTEKAGVGGEAEFVYTPEGEKQYGWRPDLFDSKGRVVGDPAGNTLAAAFFDYNSDGLLDLVTADDVPGRIRLYQNLGDFRFRQVSDENDFGVAGAWMGLAIGDIDNNGTQDLFATNLGGSMGAQHRRSATKTTYMLDILNPPNKATFYNSLWAYQNGRFRNITKDAKVDWGRWKPHISWFPPQELQPSGSFAPKPEGLEEGEFGFGTVLFDYDNDGDNDLLWIGGIRRSGVLPLSDKNIGNPGRFLENLGGGQYFIDRAATLGVTNLSDKNDRASYQNGRGVAIADFNNDGYYDIVMTSGGGWDSDNAPFLSGVGLQNRYFSFSKEYRPGPTFLYVSNAGESHWLKLKLIGTKSNRSAIGAKVTVEYRENGKLKTQLKEVRAGESFASQNSLELIFGVGAVRRIDRVTVRWPSGIMQTVQEIKLNQKLIIKEE